MFIAYELTYFEAPPGQGGGHTDRMEQDFQERKRQIGFVRLPGEK